MHYKEKYKKWLSSDLVSEDMKEELKRINDEKEIEDRFYKDLEFGTGGLRGKMGAGSNRMNMLTVSRATQGFANYLNDRYNGEEISVAIAYDSRNNSKEFAQSAALTLCANDIKVYLFDSLRPTPMLSFTVSHLMCKGGIVVTASHNPKEYNGYKVYNEYGGQVTDKDAKEIISFADSVEDFSQIKTMEYNKALEDGKLELIGEKVDKAYIERVKELTIREELIKDNAEELKVIYTPIHGSGNMPVRRALKEMGYENVHVVKEQEMPDGNFPTASYPNPEEPSVFKLALEMAEEIKPDLIFGTDPDCDRIGVVVKNNEGEYKILNGNQTGVLLGHYIISSLKEKGELPANGTVITTIVSTNMMNEICHSYGVEVLNVLTGFKYIGEKIHEFEMDNSKKFLFGFEESYGYLAGDFVKDKDAVVAATLICEMALYYKNKGMSLYEALTELYNKYGYYKEDLKSILLEGKEGTEKIAAILENLRHSMNSEIGDNKIVRKLDYRISKEKNLLNFIENNIDLPKSNVLKFVLDDNSWFVVRPSGTEPKMKIYLGARGENSEEAESKISLLKENIVKIIDSSEI